MMWDQLDRFFRRLDALRRFMVVAEAAEDSVPLHWSLARAEARASAIVCGMAELEALLGGVLDSVNAHINALSVPLKDLRPSLRPIAAHEHWKSLHGLADPAKIWSRRRTVTCFDSSTEVVALPRLNDREAIPPLDGRTLRAEHVERVAEIYGVNTTQIVTTGSVLTLKKLAVARNDIAHANVPFMSIFAHAGFSMNDLRGDLDQLDGLGYRLVVEFEDYLSTVRFLA